jgi:acetyl-CoA synthetase
VAEAAVVGASDETTGQAVVAFVILRESGRRPRRRGHCEPCATTSPSEIGPIAKPRQIMVVPELPKTRSGKIMRRLLRDVAEGRAVGDTQTLADSSVMDRIAAGQATSTED